MNKRQEPANQKNQATRKGRLIRLQEEVVSCCRQPTRHCRRTHSYRHPLEFGDVRVRHDVVLAIGTAERELARIDQAVHVLAFRLEAADVGIGLHGLTVSTPQTEVLLEHGLLEGISVEQRSDFYIEVAFGIIISEQIVHRLDTTVSIYGRSVHGGLHIDIEVGKGSFDSTLEGLLGGVGLTEADLGFSLEELKFVIAQEMDWSDLGEEPSVIGIDILELLGSGQTSISVLL